ncbi:hypothetical protein ACGH7X_41725 [Streptomyces sp. BBFR51]|uniref:hypothetical protein n=1 Tax=Streptomyces sp. BBFR51 TaxID=3372856 RepID=UPI0037DD7372
MAKVRTPPCLRGREPGTPTQPFIDALVELVQAQADTTGFVVLHRWAQILERHFPRSFPTPNTS